VPVQVDSWTDSAPKPASLGGEPDRPPNARARGRRNRQGNSRLFRSPLELGEGRDCRSSRMERARRRRRARRVAVAIGLPAVAVRRSIDGLRQRLEGRRTCIPQVTGRGFTRRSRTRARERGDRQPASRSRSARRSAAGRRTRGRRTTRRRTERGDAAGVSGARDPPDGAPTCGGPRRPGSPGGPAVSWRPGMGADTVHLAGGAGSTVRPV
jgi:hypothetical protein